MVFVGFFCVNMCHFYLMTVIFLCHNKLDYHEKENKCRIAQILRESKYILYIRECLPFLNILVVVKQHKMLYVISRHGLSK